VIRNRNPRFQFRFRFQFRERCKCAGKSASGGCSSAHLGFAHIFEL